MGIIPIIENRGKDYNEIIEQTVLGTLGNRRFKKKKKDACHEQQVIFLASGILLKGKKLI